MELLLLETIGKNVSKIALFTFQYGATATYTLTTKTTYYL